MNIAALASRFAPEKSAAISPVQPTRAARPAASPSAVVTLSGDVAPERAAQTYSAPAPRGAAPNLLDQPLLLPTRENVAKLAKAAGEAIDAKLAAAGISRTPGFELAIENVNSAHVTVKGNRSDAKAIEDLINADPQLQMAIHNTEAIASHIPGIERSMAYQDEYRAARTQQQLDQVNARYADLLSGNPPAAEIGMRYGAAGIEVTINRQAVPG